MRRFITYLMCLAAVMIAGAGSARAAIEKHVRWTAEIEKVSDTSGILKLNADIDEGWHIYGTEMPDFGDNVYGVPDPTTISIESAPGATFTDGIPEPSVAPLEHEDAMMELTLPWFVGKVSLSLPFTLDEGVTSTRIKGVVHYMSCSETACTPPDNFEFDLTFGEGAAAAVAETTPAQAPAATSITASMSPEEAEWWEPVEASTTEDSRSYWSILILGFLGGLVALLTPCVWPMIPMTVSFFLKTSKSRSKSIRDAVLYSASIVVIFLLLGIVMTLIFGPGKLNEIATSAVFNVIFFVILVVFAISFFGAFEIRLPARWSTAIDTKAETTTGIVSIFFMAFTLVLVSFSCTGPIIGTLLVEAFSQSNLMGPLLGMGGFALGLALPFGLFAFFPSMLKELPRSGGWLNTVKVVLGFIELILSLKFLSVADLAYGWGILDREIFLALWIVLFVLLGLYLLGKMRFGHDAPVETVSIPRFFLALASLSFAVYLVPGLWGAPLKGISAFAPPLYTQDFNLYGGEFREYDDFDEGMRVAVQENKPVLVDFSGYACVNCRKMEGAVFDTPEVRDIIEKDYVMVKLMVDDKTPLPAPMTVEESGETITLRTVGDRWSYLQRYKFGINSQPYYVLLDNRGKLLNAPRVYDENLQAFIEWLENGVEEYNK